MPYNFRSLTVLVVESSTLMFDATKAILKAFGVLKIYPAYDFDQGFEAFRTLHPDFIIMDWMEGEKNGLALTRKIRNDPKSPNPYVPIILATGHSLEKRVVEARDSGVTSVMVKPFTPAILYERMEQLIENPARFVRSENFTGPDRRKARDGFDGRDRRSDISSKEIYMTAEEMMRDRNRK